MVLNSKVCIYLSFCYALHKGLQPSVSSGVVSKVVEMPKPVYMHELGLMEAEGPLAVVLVTTASVHPGASGGAIVNSDGHMIGLVTRSFNSICRRYFPFLSNKNCTSTDKHLRVLWYLIFSCHFSFHE